MSLTEQSVRVLIVGAELEPERRDIWMLSAACQGVDPELFFSGRGESTAEAKEVCRGCEVRERCLEHALANCEKFGIWGGLSERQRRRLRYQRNRGVG